MKPRLTVTDFGSGNLRSVAKALERAGAEVTVSSELDARADGLVVPGQGHFGACATAMGPRAAQIRRWIDEGKPYLGICLGLQLLLQRSEESAEPGLGVLEGGVVRFGATGKVPHIGWNEVTPRPTAALFDGIPAGTRFYFVHSYYPAPADPEVCAAVTDYGALFCSAVERGAVVATQFHPEKSGDAGHHLLQNFLRMCA